MYTFLSMRHILCFVVLAAVLRAQPPPSPAVPDHPFIPLNGPYAVGVHEFLWIDQKRDEPFTQDPNDRRHIIARVWYPAEKSPGADPAPYIYDPKEFGEAPLYKRLTSVKTNSVTDAPMAKRAGRFPVLLYQPGGGMARFTATFVTEQLASRGYVVVSCDHAGFGPAVRFPDGFHFKADTLLAPEPTGKLEEDARKSFAWLRKDIFPTWVADASFALDQIEELNRASGQRFYKRLDLSRIGMFGWSFGGATSIQMSKDDRRVKAAIDQDGQLFGDVAVKGTPKPIMLMHHGMVDKTPNEADQPTLNTLMHQVEEENRSLLDHSTNDRYEVTLADTQHGHFSDLLLANPPPGQLDPRRAHEIILAYTLAFFDKYLNGHDNSLLTAPSPPYPEVTFRRLSASQ
jgi:predicted dienelactone hydrolase